ncbi:MAG: hypothetical protein JWP06_196 [Candidatus Saccharibacteria bacterium]|nr:hypothetical protein [Candidatus Saccharibacteria bacterium]
MLSNETKKKLGEIQATETTYLPSEDVARSLHDKVLVMLVGPVAIGKSFVIDQIIRTDPEFKPVPVFTTRDSRAGEDPELFRTQPHTDESLAEIFDAIDQKTLIQYTVHPTTGRIYGTVAGDYNAPYNLLATLSGAVEPRAKLPFAASHTVCLVARPEVWRLWLNKRYPENSAERTKRIEEAIICLRWALEDKPHVNISWVENNIQTPERTIEDIINIVKYNQQGDVSARKYAAQMLELAINEK